MLCTGLATCYLLTTCLSTLVPPNSLFLDAKRGMEWNINTLSLFSVTDLVSVTGSYFLFEILSVASLYIVFAFKTSFSIFPLRWFLLAVLS